MSEQRCEVTDLFIDSCAHCHPVVEELPLRSGAQISATYDSECAHCGEHYSRDAEIVYSKEAGGWCLLSHTTVPLRRTWVPPR